MSTLWHWIEPSDWNRFLYGMIMFCLGLWVGRWDTLAEQRKAKRKMLEHETKLAREYAERHGG